VENIGANVIMILKIPSGGMSKFNSTSLFKKGVAPPTNYCIGIGKRHREKMLPKKQVSEGINKKRQKLMNLRTFDNRINENDTGRNLSGPDPEKPKPKSPWLARKPQIANHKKGVSCGQISDAFDEECLVSGAGDFNGNNQVDILWRNYITISNEVWHMDGGVCIGSAELLEMTYLSWQVAAVGDFNGDCKVDILWRRYVDGANMIWYMDGITRTGYEYIETRSDLNWHVVGNGDYKN
jgi:hypothetical protein